MAVTNFSPLLGLALPTTGDLSGTWGDTVNQQITSLIDSAIAGTTTLSTDADVTLTTTTGVANQARQAILLCTGARTATRTITAPAASKAYVVINDTTGGFSVTLRGAGPTTGVSIAPGERVLLVWNGSDFARLTSTGVNSVSGTGTVNGLTLTGTVTSSGSLTLGGTLSGVNLASQVTGTLPITNGGTAVTSTPTNGQLLIGNGTGYSLATLTAGANVTITNTSGGITISATGGGGGSGTVTSVSVASANGFAGSVANPTTTPSITLSTSVTGLLKGNGTAISAAVADTDYVTPTGTVTLTNKRITLRVNSSTSTSSLSWNSSSYDQYVLTALAANLTISADAGAPTDGQKMTFRFKDNGTTRTLSWTTGTANSFRPIGVTLPTTTVASKTLYVGCVYNAADSRWDAIAVAQEA